MSNLWVDHLDDFKRSHVSKLRRRCLQLSFHLMVSRWILDQVTYHAARVWASHSIDASQLKSQHCRSCGSHGGLGWQMLSSFKVILDYHFGHHKCWEIPFRCWVIKHHEWQMWSILILLYCSHTACKKYEQITFAVISIQPKTEVIHLGFEMRLLHRTAEKMIRSFSRPWNWSTEAILSHAHGQVHEANERNL